MHVQCFGLGPSRIACFFLARIGRGHIMPVFRLTFRPALPFGGMYCTGVECATCSSLQVLTEDRRCSQVQRMASASAVFSLRSRGCSLLRLLGWDLVLLLARRVAVLYGFVLV